jgi:hypothetical protein
MLKKEKDVTNIVIASNVTNNISDNNGHDNNNKHINMLAR